MKANRKFRANDEAVSPVIAVILMVAITVVLAATVYVWVSGFGSSSSSPAKTISLSSAGALANGFKNYTVASATSGLKYSDLTFTVEGVTQDQDLSTTNACVSDAANLYAACKAGATVTSAATVVSAGDQLNFRVSSGQTLRILDSQANSVILTLVVG